MKPFSTLMKVFTVNLRSFIYISNIHNKLILPAGVIFTFTYLLFVSSLVVFDYKLRIIINSVVFDNLTAANPQPDIAFFYF